MNPLVKIVRMEVQRREIFLAYVSREGNPNILLAPGSNSGGLECLSKFFS